MSACPQDEQLARFAEQELGEAETASIAAHVESCAVCSQVAAALLKLRSSTGLGETLASPAPGPLLASGTVLGRFTVQHEVGAGAMGVVFAARDPLLDRRVALKLLKGASSLSAQARLHREAQAMAMAKLSHRNVATVFDVGTWQDRSWVAMEFIDGVTLRDWWRTQPSVQAKLDKLLEAGRGLAAAHEVSLVHRDFKPDNVLVEKTGRAVVTDFGLSSSRGGAGELASPHVSQEGLLVGTPAYMAPEQLEARPADALSDQFAFCILAVEAFAGRRPFAAHNLEGLREAIAAGPLPEVMAAVPTPLRAPLLRGLSPSPAARFPTMAALLAELESAWQRPRSRRRAALAAGLVVLVAGGAVAGFKAYDSRVCTGGQEKLASVWNAQSRQRLREGLGATGAPFAATSAQALEGALEGWAVGWLGSWQRACEATERRNEQSTQLLDLRLQCLDERLDGLRAVMTQLSSADAETLAKLGQAPRLLGGLEACEDTASLQRREAVPQEPQLRTKVDTARARVRDALSQSELGHPREALAVVSPLLAELEGLGWRPALAEGQVVLGRVQLATGDAAAAGKTLEQAALTTEAARSDVELLRALLFSAWVQLGMFNKPVEAQRLLDRAKAVGSHVKEPELDRRRRRLEAMMLAVTGKPAEAAKLEQGLVDELAGTEGEELAASRESLAASLSASGQRVAAAVELREVVRLREKALGASHPLVGKSLVSLGVTLAATQSKEAIALVERGLELTRAALGPEHPQTATALFNLGTARFGLGDARGAREPLEQAREIFKKLYGRKDRRVAQASSNLAVILKGQGLLAEATEAATEAFEVQQELAGADHPLTGKALLPLCDVERAAGKFEEALAHAQEAERILEKTDRTAYSYALQYEVATLRDLNRFAEGVKRGRVLWAATEASDTGAAEKSAALAILAEVEADAGDLAAAEQHVAQAIEWGEQAPERKDELASTRLLAAQIHFRSPKKRAGACAAAKQAVAEFRAAGRKDHLDYETWLTKSCAQR